MTALAIIASTVLSCAFALLVGAACIVVMRRDRAESQQDQPCPVPVLLVELTDAQTGNPVAIHVGMIGAVYPIQHTQGSTPYYGETLVQCPPLNINVTVIETYNTVRRRMAAVSGTLQIEGSKA